ncbi:RpiR family transcriptional regulator [Acinetobacter sp. ANC 4558]|uniref:DNA-binding transcriptional regulator HcaR n=1 Tax=Acinetobacter sp. ANC 4558 TaxID=1977876 RepID=UPI000A3426DA|nr:DNA-binding transcriptional regulator HcaR [Acinetobacter sp. ANC 4558]OTG86137.1 RpiR family transcriptional regulator [Acinetobacter sp. ANC 4558]
MELRHLRYFITVSEELNFSKAAQKLFTAQPSLSQQIKDLEDRLNLKLFNRTKRKVELTEEGRIFLDYARTTVAQADQAIHLTREAAKAQKNILKIGYVPVVEIKVFPHILPSFRFEHPELKLALRSMNDIKQIEALKDEEIDIGFIRENKEDENLTSQLILREKMIFILPKDHPLAQYHQIPLQALKNINMIIPSIERSPALHLTVMNFSKKNNLNFNIIQHAENILFNINSVSMGLGCAILPNYIEPILKTNDRITTRRLEIDLPLIDLFVCYHRKNNQRNIKQFLDTLFKKLP